jgi:hypothetical protein
MVHLGMQGFEHFVEHCAKVLPCHRDDSGE